eukprot:sb/3471742/
MPDLLHIVPVGHDSVLDGVLEGEDTPLALGLITDIQSDPDLAKSSGILATKSGWPLNMGQIPLISYIRGNLFSGNTYLNTSTSLQFIMIDSTVFRIVQILEIAFGGSVVNSESSQKLIKTTKDSSNLIEKFGIIQKYSSMEIYSCSGCKTDDNTRMKCSNKVRYIPFTHFLTSTQYDI